MFSESAKLSSQVTISEIEFPSLKESVTIRRDDRGIPYIQAANEADLFFAQGYATAFDRLWQMDFLRRMARGELAEILGPNAVELDKLHRVYGFRKLAETLFAGASTQTRAVLESYASGVNAFIQTRSVTLLPKEFQVLGYAPQKWNPVDSLALGKLFAESLSVSVDVDILRALLAELAADKFDALFPRTCPLDLILIGTDAGNRTCGVPLQLKLNEPKRAALTALLKGMRRLRAASGADTQAGSNAWIVSGKLTASGAPMLANDPHLPPTSPSIWHITHLSTAGFRVAGVSVPGLPGVMIGHNKHIAWGLTNLCPDVQDLYFEEFNETEPQAYRTPDGWRRAELRKEEIKIRHGSAVETVTIDIKVTRHGR